MKEAMAAKAKLKTRQARLAVPALLSSLSLCWLTNFLPLPEAYAKSAHHGKVPIALAQESKNNGNFAGNSEERQMLLTMSYLTWWSLDSEGYHPCILVKVQNVSGHDLTGQLITFRTHFIDLRSGNFTPGKAEIRQAFENGKQVHVIMRGRHAFELPRSTEDWPPLECKVIAVIGEQAQQTTQSLLLTKVEKITMTDEDAMYKINRMADFVPQPNSKTQGKK